MQFYIMTLFPEMVMQGLSTSIIGRAVNKGFLSIEAVNIRDYAFNKHSVWMIIRMAEAPECLCRQNRCISVTAAGREDE